MIINTTQKVSSRVLISRNMISVARTSLIRYPTPNDKILARITPQDLFLEENSHFKNCNTC